MKESGKSISWNWAAFFMGIYWMVYRKMYFKAGVDGIFTDDPALGRKAVDAYLKANSTTM